VIVRGLGIPPCLLENSLPMAKSPHKGFIIQRQQTRLDPPALERPHANAYNEPIWLSIRLQRLTDLAALSDEIVRI
jgi:hypothetical protein